MRRKTIKTIAAVLVISTIAGSTNVNVVQAKSDTYKIRYTKTALNVRKKPSVKSKKLGTLKFNKKIRVITTGSAVVSKKWLKIRYNGKVGYVSKKYTSKKKAKYVSMATPSNNQFKSYMSYRCITNTSSAQYRLQQKAYSGNYGIRMVGDRYCVAVGSYYTTKIGTKLDLVMANGSIIKCILADCKANEHTDGTNRQNPNGSIAEFIVDMNTLNREARRMGNLSYCSSEFKGEISSIRVYK